MLFQNCVEPNDDDLSEPTYLNTLSSISVGDGSIGASDDYFYDFNDAIDAKFFKYSRSRFSLSYEDYIASYPYPPDYMMMKNFPDYLLDIAPDSIQYTTRHPIENMVIGSDTITSEIGKIVEDSLTLSSLSLNLESIGGFRSKSISAGYRLRNSGWIQEDALIYYSDTLTLNHIGL